MAMSSEAPESIEQHRLHVQQLFIRHQQALLSFVHSIEPNSADAQDIVQEVFLAVSKKAATWSTGTNFHAWICTVARYEVLNFQRARARRAARLDQDVVELVCAESPPDLEEFEHRVSLVRKCLDRLSPKARKLILLRYHNALMPEAIASTVGWTVNSVRVALTRSRQILRECLERQLSLEKAS